VTNFNDVRLIFLTKLVLPFFFEISFAALVFVGSRYLCLGIKCREWICTSEEETIQLYKQCRLVGEHLKVKVFDI